MLKSLYGLKLDPKAWYEKIDHFFLTLGFKCCQYDHSIYTLHVNGETLIIALYANDLVTTRRNTDLILGLKKHLVDIFEMTILVLLHFLLGIQVL